MTKGKCLADLAHEIDVLCKPVKTVMEDKACISWQDDGTLAYFSHNDGYPECYYAPWTDFANNRENFTSLSRFLQFMKRNIDANEYLQYLLTAPVWQVIEEHSQVERDAFNALLAGIEINL